MIRVEGREEVDFVSSDLKRTRRTGALARAGKWTGAVILQFPYTPRPAANENNRQGNPGGKKNDKAGAQRALKKDLAQHDATTRKQGLPVGATARAASEKSLASSAASSSRDSREAFTQAAAKTVSRKPPKSPRPKDTRSKVNGTPGNID